MSNNPEAFLKISDSLASVIVQAIESDGTGDGDMDARLFSENVASLIMDSIVIDISDSMNADGSFTVILDPDGPLADIDE